MPEAPETPAPLFAIRAFKSALFGTPGADDEGEAENTLQSKQQADSQQNKTDSRRTFPENMDGPENAKKANADTGGNTIPSPTKSILLTPGTASNRRKTVSFGDGVVDNERKRDTSSKSSKTSSNSSGPLSSQWMSGPSDGKNKPRSKLTQTLLDARDGPSNELASSHSVKAGKEPAEVAPQQATPPVDDNDITTNLNEPRSESGKYWKAEFDSYRTKTTKEIKKLIQYRSVAKSYARKKDEEASRLAHKLQEEENRVAEMERHVSQLASTMVGEGEKADKEQLVRDLTKQTALALQYKHRVSLLRKLLEKHGVVGSEVDDIGEHSDVDSPSSKTAGDLRKTQQALDLANAKIEDQQTELDKLQNLAQSSEQKASKLEQDNMSLKHTLSRVKQEMNKFEGRRLEKEGKLKQREAKLEERVKEYRERLKRAHQEHRSKEQDLNASFDEERCRLMEEIHLLRTKLRNNERLHANRAHRRHSYNLHTADTSTQIHDLEYNFLEPNHNETDDSDEPPSPSPRSKRDSWYSRPATANLLDQKGDPEVISLGDDEELTSSEDLPARQGYRSRQAVHDNDDLRRPSQHHNMKALSTSTMPGRQRYSRDNHRTQRRPQTNASLLHHLTNLDDHQQAVVRESLRSPVKYSLDAITGFSRPNAVQDAGKRDNLSTVERAAISVDRMVAARVRLKQKEARRKARLEGKENIALAN
ncbi:hypothetical protein PHISCL_05071 [Aspergillus sclerotialis]|uniref:Spindle pole body-associated protein cut12 domain-containing protein n=1 Tax=Aspergillus sclerotialis TaxID=2070753 RepID=A0A3A2ZJX1_9EURO|nr:hypothetical protein PHISCL_05071 [Aspergillus sclerotialis]